MPLPSLLRQYVPPVGSVFRLARDLHDPSDPKETRRLVVVAHQDGGAVMIPRATTGPRHPTDILHGLEHGCGCDRPGWWQPLRSRFVAFDVLDRGTPDALRYTAPLNPTTLSLLVTAWEKR
mgnify:CR=1 FL=1